MNAMTGTFIRKAFLGSLIVVLLSVSTAPVTALAQTTQTTTNGPAPAVTSNTAVPAPAATSAAPKDASNPAATTAAPSASSNQSTAGEDPKAVCNFGSVGNLVTCLSGFMYSIIKGVALFFLSLASVMLGIVGLLFNWTIYITVFQFGNLIGNNEGMLAAWGVLRDIGNIILLFGFIFMGISTILNLPGNEFTARKALPTLLIFALLMNFSLFAAEAIIDTSNALGSTFYRQAGTGLCPAEEKNPINCATNYGVAGAIMKLSGITRIFDPDIFNHKDQFPDNDSGAAIAIIGLTIFISVLAMVLLAAVFMLIARAVTLAFLMVVSPIGFAGMAIPPLHRFAKTWWDSLLSQAFFAPVYLLLVLISVKFLDGIRTALGTDGTMSLLEVFKASGVSNLSMVVLYILLIGFLLAAGESAKAMSAVGSGSATKMAGAVVFGGMARVSNTVIGGTARAARNTIQGTPILNKLPGAQFVTTNILKPVENANTDVRNWVGAGRLQQYAGGPAEHATLPDMIHQVHDVKKGMADNARQYNKEVATKDLAREAHSGKELSDESGKFLAGLSADDIAADHDLQHSIGALADKLSPSQFEGLMKSDKITADLKNEMRENRFKEVKAMSEVAYSSGNRSEVQKLSNKDLEMLARHDPETFKKLLEVKSAAGESLMSDDQIEALSKNQDLTNSQRANVYANSRKGRIEAQITVYEKAMAAGKLTEAQVADGLIQQYVNSLNSKGKAKLTGSTLTHQSLLGSYTAADLAEIQREGKLDRSQIATIAAAVRNPAHPNNRTTRDWLAKNANADSYWQ